LKRLDLIAYGWLVFNMIKQILLNCLSDVCFNFIVVEAAVLVVLR
jgi:hypothetical protein